MGGGGAIWGAFEGWDWRRVPGGVGRMRGGGAGWGVSAGAWKQAASASQAMAPTRPLARI